MNRIARLVFFSFALVIAFAVSFAVYKKISNPNVLVAREAGPATAKIAVAVKDLRRGDKIAAEDIRMAAYMQDTLPKGHFAAPEQSVGRIVISPISATGPILETNLAPKELTKGGMAAIISPEKRAMAVKVDNVIGVAGFLHPGHQVDVLVSLDHPGEKQSQITKTVLENILVLSVGTQAQESEDKKPQQVTVATLEVTLEEGEKLALAVNQGSIQLALRGYSDSKPVLTKGITAISLLESYSVDVIEPVVITEETTGEPVVQQARPKLIVEVMNGNKVDKISITR